MTSKPASKIRLTYTANCRFCFELGYEIGYYIARVDEYWGCWIAEGEDDGDEFISGNEIDPVRTDTIKAVFSNWNTTGRLSEFHSNLPPDDRKAILNEWLEFGTLLKSFGETLLQVLERAELPKGHFDQNFSHQETRDFFNRLVSPLNPEKNLATDAVEIPLDDGNFDEFASPLNPNTNSSADVVEISDEQLSKDLIITRNDLARLAAIISHFSVSDPNNPDKSSEFFWDKTLEEIHSIWVKSNVASVIREKIKHFLDAAIKVAEKLKDSKHEFLLLGITIAKLENELDKTESTFLSTSIDHLQADLVKQVNFFKLLQGVLGKLVSPQGIDTLTRPIGLRELGDFVVRLRHGLDIGAKSLEHGIWDLRWDEGRRIVSREGFNESIDLIKSLSTFRLFKVLAKSDKDSFVPEEELNVAYGFRLNNEKQIITKPISKLRDLLEKLEIGIEPGGDRSYRLSDLKKSFDTKRIAKKV